MPHSKKPRLLLSDSTRSASAPRRSLRIAGRPNASMDDLSDDLLALIFGCLGPVDIMRARCCKKWKEAAKNTMVPLTDFKVDSVRKYNAMAAMATALPNLQQITLGDLCAYSPDATNHKYVDGDDPDEEWAASTAGYTTHDIGVLSNFRNLRSLKIDTAEYDAYSESNAPLSGRYPFLFNFSLLMKLSIGPPDDADRGVNLFCPCSIRWDLEDLRGLRFLKELHCNGSRYLSGNIRSLRVLKDTLEKVVIMNCGSQFVFRSSSVEGNFMDLADFPLLKVLNLTESAVTGDIGQIGQNDFMAIETIELPSGVYGGTYYKFQRISDVPGVVHAIYRLMKRTPTIFRDFHLRNSQHQLLLWKLSADSSDFYRQNYQHRNGFIRPPFNVGFVRVGSRLGWCWYSGDLWSVRDGCLSCEINWLDPEPSSECSDYELYVKELQDVQKFMRFYRGFHLPPTEMEYNQLLDEPHI
eukprot:scaffold5305_cov68-Skeletonema_dohrnii-CCMP3373.AAC.1